MAKVSHGIGTLPKNFNGLSKMHERYRQTDKQTTDRRMDDDI